MKRNSKKMSSIIFGLLVMAAGVLLFAFNGGYLPEKYKTVVFSWQMLLVAAGFVFLFSRDKRIAGVIMMLIGVFLILPKLNIEGIEFVTQNGWAIALIVFGIFVICGAIGGKRIYHAHMHWHTAKTDAHDNGRRHSSGWKFSENKSGFIERDCVFGGNKEKIDVKNFCGGDINSVFGGIELDLSEAQLAEGVHHLELNSVFGSIVIFVPAEWNIEIQQTQFFGHFADNRPKPPIETDFKRTLMIEINAVFGGGEVRCK